MNIHRRERAKGKYAVTFWQYVLNAGDPGGFGSVVVVAQGIIFKCWQRSDRSLVKKRKKGVRR